MLHLCGGRAVAVAVILAGCLSIGGQVDAQVLKADYSFRKTLTSTVAGAPALENIGVNAFAEEPLKGQPRPVLQFPEGGGVALNGAKALIPGGVYTIIVQFRFDTVANYRRIIDFKNGTVDDGLYTLNGALYFYNIAGGAEPVIQPGKFVTVMLTRDQHKKVRGYVDGRLQFTFVDENDEAVVNEANTLRFFKDDGPTEQSAGAVARIRLYSGALVVAQAPGKRLPLRMVAGREPIPAKLSAGRY